MEQLSSCEIMQNVRRNYLSSVIPSSKCFQHAKKSIKSFKKRKINI